MTTRTIAGRTINSSNFVEFPSRDMRNRGARGTWVRVNDNGTVDVQLAAKGTIGSGYLSDLKAFCDALGAGEQFSSIRCGDRITFTPHI